MFNTNNNNNTNLNVNACSGGIYKTYFESWFERFNLKSQRANQLLGSEESRCGAHMNEVILQMVICGDMEVMAEIINKQDLEKHLIK